MRCGRSSGFEVMNANASWVATIEAPDFSVLSELRLVPGLEVAPLPPILWLRGPDWNDGLALSCRKIPGLRRFTVIQGGRLLADGARVPLGFLPELRWQPLRDRLPVELPPPVGSVVIAPRAPLALVRSATEQPANALLVDGRAWCDFATATAEIRLHPLRFAAARDGRVWVEGAPVPSLPGRRYFQRLGVAVPCGWDWSPALDPAVLRRWLGLAAGDAALAFPEGGWEIIKAEQFVPASRQAARLTAEVLAHV